MSDSSWGDDETQLCFFTALCDREQEGGSFPTVSLLLSETYVIHPCVVMLSVGQTIVLAETTLQCCQTFETMSQVYLDSHQIELYKAEI